MMFLKNLFATDAQARLERDLELVRKALGFFDRDTMLAALKQFREARELSDRHAALVQIPALDPEIARFKQAITDLAAARDEVAELKNDIELADAVLAAQKRDLEALRPDALKRARDRKAAKREGGK